MDKVVIKNDVFNVAKRIKQINAGYILVYNNISEKFEVCYKSINNVQVILPYKNLDSRSVQHIQKTRIENRDKLIKEIDEYNEKLQQQNNNKIKQEILDKVKYDYKI